MPKAPPPPHVLARINPRGCPHPGRVLFPPEPDRRIEERFFRGWSNILSPDLHRLAGRKTSSTLQVIEDQGRRVLEWPERIPCLTVAGDAGWRDVEVACEVRCVQSTCGVYDHDEMTFAGEGRTGLALRVQDSRRHYFAGFLGGKRLAIAVRDDAKWSVLARVDFATDPRRYHRLVARCAGAAITVMADGRTRLSVEDGRWASGAAGLYANTVTRWRAAEIRCSAGEWRGIRARRALDRADLAAAAAGVPRARVALDIRLPARALGARFGGVLGSGPRRLLLDWAERRAGAPCRTLAALDLDGRVAWRRSFPSPREFEYATDDLDGDGAPEVVLLDGSHLRVLDGRTGRDLFRADYPEGSPFFHFRGEKARFNRRCPKIWRTGGPSAPSRIILFEFTGAGGHTIWSYDHRLRLRWVHHNPVGKYGHNLERYDVDGDGREEIVAGYYALDDEGRYAWRVKDQDLIFKQDHTDNLWVGKFGGEDDVPKVIAVAGEAGVIWIDARDGTLLKRRRGIGHMQRLAVGRFLHDRPGLQAWAWTDWGSPGIYSLLDGAGRTHRRFQPDPRCTDGAAVTWWRDGRQLLLIRATPEARGLWDASGRRVVDLSARVRVPEIEVARLTTPDTDQLVTIEGTRLRVFAPSLG